MSEEKATTETTQSPHPVEEEPEKGEKVVNDQAEEKLAEIDPAHDEDVSPKARSGKAEFQELEEDQLPVPVESRTEVLMNEFDCLPTTIVTHGTLLTCLASEAWQHLMSGARADHGLRPGCRVYFECKILEVFGARGTYPSVKMGLTLAGEHHLVGSNTSCGFDLGGGFHGHQRRKVVGERIYPQDIMGVLINLVPGHPNADTISLFKNGVRVSEPQKLPEGMLGQTVYPTVAFRGLAVSVNLGGQELFAPPKFAVRMVSHEDASFLERSPCMRCEGEKYEVIVPVGIPDEGTYDVVDEIHKASPGKYFEISERFILQWCRKSALQRADKRSPYGYDGSNDQPSVCLEVPCLDQFTCKKQLIELASSLRRHLLIVNVRENLLEEHRRALVKLFSAPHFQRIAWVTVGEPPAGFVQLQQEEEQRALQLQANTEFEKKRAEKERISAIKVKAALDKAKEESDDKSVKDGADETEQRTEGKDAVEKETAEKEVAEKEVAEKEVAEKEVAEKEVAEKETAEKEEAENEEKLECPVVPLPSCRFRTRRMRDIKESTLQNSYLKFSIPSDAEGFDEVRFMWDDSDGASAYLFSWQQEARKKVLVELTPGEWFQSKKKAFIPCLQEWKEHVAMYCDQVDTLKKAKQAALDMVKNEQSKTEQDGEASPKKDSPSTEVDILTVDAWTSEIKNAKDGAPLFIKFTNEDWLLLAVRFYFHAMVHAIKKDSEGHPGIHKSLIGEYFRMYWGRRLVTGEWGARSLDQLLEILQDTVVLNDDIVESKLPEDTSLDTFVRLTEVARRDRLARIEAGEDAALHFEAAKDSYGKSRNKGYTAGYTPGYGSYGQYGSYGGGYSGSYNYNAPPRQSQVYGAAAYGYGGSYGKGKGGSYPPANSGYSYYQRGSGGYDYNSSYQGGEHGYKSGSYGGGYGYGQGDQGQKRGWEGRGGDEKRPKTMGYGYRQGK